MTTNTESIVGTLHALGHKNLATKLTEERLELMRAVLERGKLLRDIRDYLRNHDDVDTRSDGSQVPNEANRMLTEFGDRLERLL